MTIKNKTSVLIVLLLLILSSKAHSQANSNTILSDTYSYVYVLENDQIVRELDLNMNVSINVTKGTGNINYKFEDNSFNGDFVILNYSLYKSYIHFIIIDEEFEKADLIFIEGLEVMIQIIDETVFIFTNNRSNLSLESPIGKEEKVETYYYQFK